MISYLESALQVVHSSPISQSARVSSVCDRECLFNKRNTTGPLNSTGELDMRECGSSSLRYF
jgi:hypothetical protein